MSPPCPAEAADPPDVGGVFNLITLKPPPCQPLKQETWSPVRPGHLPAHLVLAASQGLQQAQKWVVGVMSCDRINIQLFLINMMEASQDSESASLSRLR